MLLELLSENSSLEKSRRAVLTVSLLILFFSAVEFRSDEIEIFSLKVAFSQERFVALGQLCLFYLFSIYSIKIVVQFGSWGVMKGISTVKNWEDDAHEKFERDMNQPTEEDHYRGNDYDEHDDIRLAADKRRYPFKVIEKIITKFDVSSRIFFQFCVPLILGLVAFFFPNSLAILLELFMRY